MEERNTAPEDGLLFELHYQTAYGDVMEGLRLLEGKKKVPIVLTAVLAAFAVGLLWVSGALAALSLAACLYLAYSRLLRPWMKSRKLAREIAGKGATYRLRVFAKGFSLTEGESTHRMLYRDMAFAEDQDVFLLALQNSALMVIPKRFFVGNLGKAQELFRETMRAL